MKKLSREVINDAINIIKELYSSDIFEDVVKIKEAIEETFDATVDEKDLEKYVSISYSYEQEDVRLLYKNIVQ